MKLASLKITALFLFLIAGGVISWCGAPAWAQMTDRTQNPNVANFGIAKSLTQEVGAGAGDWITPDSSSFIIARDPFRSWSGKTVRGDVQWPQIRFLLGNAPCRQNAPRASS